MLCDALLLVVISGLTLFVLTPELTLLQWGAAWLGSLAAAVGVFHTFGLYRQIIRYITEQALFTLLKAVLATTFLWLVWLRILFPDWPLFRLGLAGWVFGVSLVTLVGALRFGLRALLWRPLQHQYSGRQAFIYGANDAGWQLVSALRQSKEIFPAAFVDDDPAVIGKEFGGLPVYAPDEIPLLLRRYQIQEAIVALPHASEYKRRQVIERLTQHNLRVRVMPPVADFTAGRYLPRIVREVDVGDLLGRNRVQPDLSLLQRSVAGRSVMVTGAGGSIGSELCRQIALLGPKRLVLVEANEFALYRVQQELLEMGFSALVPALGTVEDQPWLEGLLAQHRICTVFHAAAYKHVPLVEQNLISGVRNNVIGSARVVAACRAQGVSRFVLISSDKAVHPSNVMGATKRWAELITLAAAHQERARGNAYCVVRFGNVLGSSGSVVPLFQRQILRGGPITVTHPEVTRYFMSIHEAVELVLQASSIAQGGEVFLLDMGEPVAILDLARKLIRLAGLSERTEQNPDGDIEIIFTGLRPGEKLHETLVIGENVQPTQHPKIRRAIEPFWEEAALQPYLAALQQAIQWREGESVRAVLFAILSEKTPFCAETPPQ
nr:nucleoside-diphosphate sugar epimerase/dehydratase [Hydrogenophilus thiooxidans]